MQKQFITTLLIAAAAQAEAHTLANDEGLPSQLGHQLLGLHHLPLTALLIIAAVFLFRRLRTSYRLDKKQNP